MRKVFENARGFKPKACRSESFETYLIGLNKKA
jgi:23S rRNA (uridine2552-2'-O)-methyltransferase